MIRFSKAKPMSDEELARGRNRSASLGFGAIRIGRILTCVR